MVDINVDTEILFAELVVTLSVHRRNNRHSLAVRIAAGADNALAGVRTNKRNVFHERVDVFENRVVDTLKYVFSYGGFDKVRIVDMSVAVRRVRKNLASTANCAITSLSC